MTLASICILPSSQLQLRLKCDIGQDDGFVRLDREWAREVRVRTEKSR